MCVGLDDYGQLYDLYFPYVGLENHTGGSFVHKIGFFVEGKFSWTSDPGWEINYSYSDESQIRNKIFMRNTQLGIEVQLRNEVYNELNIFLRELKIKNLGDSEKAIKIFFNQQFEIYESHRGDTAYYDPENNVVIHYKGRRNFLVNAKERNTENYFSEFSIGLNGIEGKQGTWMDAIDGKLEGNPIEHGLTDSVIGLEIKLNSNDTAFIDYWLTIAKNIDEAYSLNHYVIDKTVDYLITTTTNFWQAWLNRYNIDFTDLDKDIIDLYKNSLKILRAHTDNNGAIIASSDTDLLKYGRDAYSYVWPRDSAFASIAYSRAGYDDINKKVLEFFNDTITRPGYFMHKYRADKSIGSSWHPWIFQGMKELPIQLDETALAVYAIYEDYKNAKDIEFLEKIYNSLLKKAIDFIITRIDMETGLIRPSYDLWEEHYGTATFTSATVYGALTAAAEIANAFGKSDKAEEYRLIARLVQNAILTYHFDSEKGIFVKRILKKEFSNNEEDLIDSVIDISALYGIYRFKVLDVVDDSFKMMQNKVKEKLHCQTGIGGFPRYENDKYFKENENVQGNPWIITTLWIAQIEIEQADNIGELENAKSYLRWATDHSTDSGVLYEQLDPETGIGKSAGPLTWSHAEFIVTVLDYLKKKQTLLERMND